MESPGMQQIQFEGHESEIRVESWMHLLDPRSSGITEEDELDLWHALSRESDSILEQLSRRLRAAEPRGEVANFFEAFLRSRRLRAPQL